ncbi:cardiolipin synthase [Marvinbryantia formatexigens]|nr:cardiolipin synthase [Marvinbryantia formatexigens]UWO24732.1 cardiolipin synthase [Marvinbryantia formatexigens DSM 14469]SDF21073.1 cardiolipin synthase [Marvinbryantia formatexigens]
MENEKEKEKQLLTKPKEKLKKGKQGILHVIFSRTGIIFLMILIQLGILLICFKLIRDYVFITYWAMVFLGFCLVIVIIGRRGNPAFQIAWIVPILTVPVFGALFYLYFYAQIGSRQLNKLILEEQAKTASLVEQNPETERMLQEESQQMTHLATYLRNASGSAVHRNTSAKYFSSGEEAFEPLLQELRGAKKFIFIEFFIIGPGYMWESVLEILKAKAQEGVEVRLLYDGMNELFRLPRDYPQELEKYGIKCRVFAPIIPALSTTQNNRDHRKIVVVDGRMAMTGGINLADEYINRKERFGYWKDAAVIIEGEAVKSFTLMFLRTWKVANPKNQEEVDYRSYIDVPPAERKYPESGYVLPFDDNPLDGELTSETVYMDILYSAKKYVHIMTPYLVPDHEMIVALTYAAKRGVDVRIMMPHIPDKKYAFLLARTYYDELLDAGVKISEFEPGFVHTKAIVSDDEKAVVGSINMDFRSFYLSFECGVLLYQNTAVAELENDFQTTLEKCLTVTHDFYQKQPLIFRIAGKVLRLFAPLM